MHVVIALLLLVGVDDFSRLEGQALAGLPNSPDAAKHESLTMAAIAQLPNVLGGTRTPLIVVKTSEGNLARLLVSPAFRKPVGGEGEPIPVLVIEKLDTFESGPATNRIARCRDLVLFDGFRLDLDSGQVVPDGQGGDLQFLAAGDGGIRLVAIKPAALFTLSKSPLPKAQATVPSPGRTVLKGDFAGTYRLFANGQTTGQLELKVDEAGGVSGRLKSDQTGGSYKVTGQVDGAVANKIRFDVELPRARQEFDGFLFVEGKGGLSGSFGLLGRTFGFFAVREGGILAPDGEEIGDTRFDQSRPGCVTFDVDATGWRLDGNPIDEDAAAKTMRAALDADSGAWARIKLQPDAPAGRLLRLVELLRDVGANTIRIAASDKK